MSRSPGRRKSSLKQISAIYEPPRPSLTFKWSLSAAHLAALEDNPAIIFPSIEVDRSQRKFFTGSPFLTDQNSVSHCSIYTGKSSRSSKYSKKSQSPTSSQQNKNSSRSSPLLLTYAQLHCVPPPVPVRRSTRARLSIFPVAEDKQTNISVVSSKVSSVSKSYSPSPSSTTITLLSPKAEQHLPEDHLVRLHTPQLRSLNVSDKYMNEAKKLYYNVNCRSFVPRVGVTQVF